MSGSRAERPSGRAASSGRAGPSGHADSEWAELVSAAATRAGGLDPALLGDVLASLAGAVSTGTRVRRRDLGRYGDLGRAAAASGVALRVLLDAYLDAAGHLWPHLPEVLSGNGFRTVQAGEVLLRGVRDVVAAVTEGFQLAGRELARLHGTAGREFVDDLLLGGTHSAESLRARAESFGLTLVGPHAVAVVTAERGFTDGSALTGILERSLLGSKADADALVATKEDRLVVIFAAPDRAAVAFVVGRLTSVLPDASGPVRLERTAAVGDWRMGIGRPRSGPIGIRLGYEEALQALDLGGRSGMPGPVFDAAELLVQRLLVSDEAAMREVVEAVLGPLARARGGAAPLVATLHAFFDAGGNVTAAARLLHLSVRAMTYRLDRIATLTGRDLADPADRFALQTAVTGARLLGLDR